MRFLLSTFLLLFCSVTFVVAEETAPAKEAAKPEGVFDENLPSPTVAKVPELEQFLIIPLRIYRLKSTDLPAANCELTDKDLHRIVGKVNRVWAYGGVYFGLESIVEETAATDRLLRLPEKEKQQEEKAEKLSPQKKQEEPRSKAEEKAEEKKSDTKGSSPDKQAATTEEAVKEKKEPAPKPPGQGADQLLESRLYRAIIPAKTREFPGFRVYYIHQFDVNGIYYGRREAMVKETARLRKVPGGIDEPLPRVTSHELGHGLTLVHRQDTTNLMASGTTGTTFNEAEVAQARKAARELPATIKYADLEKPDAKRSEAEQKQRAEWGADLRAIVKELQK